jgi:hypothetical protein
MGKKDQCSRSFGVKSTSGGRFLLESAAKKWPEKSVQRRINEKNCFIQASGLLIQRKYSSKDSITGPNDIRFKKNAQEKQID